MRAGPQFGRETFPVPLGFRRQHAGRWQTQTGRASCPAGGELGADKDYSELNGLAGNGFR